MPIEGSKALGGAAGGGEDEAGERHPKPCSYRGFGFRV